MTTGRDNTRRISSVDIVRGAVIVLMALDHVRDYVTNVRFQPEDLSQSSAALFATRWVTHFCAPTFFLLAGAGIGIALSRGKRPADMSRYLLRRGLWLLVLELIITPIGWQFGFDLVPAFALVLWALGWSMIVMALLVHVSPRILAPLSLVMIFGHNLLDTIAPESFGAFAGVWRVLHVPGFMFPGVLFVAYPLVPWVGVMAIGRVLAGAYQWDAVKRRNLLVWSGAAAVILFVVLRALNGYGNAAPWAPQRTPALTVASFLNVMKYPPSLDFLLMTLGPTFLALALTEHARGRVTRWLAVYGRVPLFFYVAHIFVAHVAAMVLALVQGGELRRIQIITNPGSIPDWYGLPLTGVYAVWAIVVVLMYFPCRRVGQLEDAHGSWWLPDIWPLKRRLRPAAELAHVSSHPRGSLSEG
jgi:uncharacterized membrane protein